MDRVTVVLVILLLAAPFFIWERVEDAIGVEVIIFLLALLAWIFRKPVLFLGRALRRVLTVFLGYALAAVILLAVCLPWPFARNINHHHHRGYYRP